MIGSAQGYEKLLQLLLDQAASIAPWSRRGHRSAGWLWLDHTSRHGKEEMVSLLIEKCADINKATSSFPRFTPLIMATVWCTVACVRRLLMRKTINMNARDHYGRAALFFSIVPEITKLLLDRGAHPTIARYDGATPLVSAKGRIYLEMVNLLEVREGSKLSVCFHSLYLVPYAHLTPSPSIITGRLSWAWACPYLAQAAVNPWCWTCYNQSQKWCCIWYRIKKGRRRQ